MNKVAIKAFFSSPHNTKDLFNMTIRKQRDNSPCKDVGEPRNSLECHVIVCRFWCFSGCLEALNRCMQLKPSDVVFPLTIRHLQEEGQLLELP